MKVVFVEEVEGSGRVGEVKVVKNGYARNFLLPRGFAVPATKDNLERAERLATADTIRQNKLDGDAKAIADKIEGAAITLTARVGQQGRLFGSITASDIADRLSEIAGTTVDHRQVLLGQSIRTIGTQDVRVRLTRNVSAGITVEVQSEEGAQEEPTIEEAVAAADAEEAAAEGAESGDAKAAAQTSTDASADGDSQASD